MIPVLTMSKEEIEAGETSPPKVAYKPHNDILLE